jgi:hypothetical protein
MQDATELNSYAKITSGSKRQNLLIGMCAIALLLFHRNYQWNYMQHR